MTCSGKRRAVLTWPSTVLVKLYETNPWGGCWRCWQLGKLKLQINKRKQASRGEQVRHMRKRHCFLFLLFLKRFFMCTIFKVFIEFIAILFLFSGFVWFFFVCEACGILAHQKKVKVFVTQSCPTLRDPIDYSPPGSSLSMEFSRQEYWSG